MDWGLLSLPSVVLIDITSVWADKQSETGPADHPYARIRQLVLYLTNTSMHNSIAPSQSVKLINSNMSSLKPQTRTILITGATGQQGQALIAALRPRDHNSNSNLNSATASAALASEAEIEYHVLALTRNKNSDIAKRLAGEKHVSIVEGDLSQRESIRKIFEDAQSEGDRIWGVFAVMAYPGLNKDAEGEERQGKVSFC